MCIKPLQKHNISGLTLWDSKIETNTNEFNKSLLSVPKCQTKRLDAHPSLMVQIAFPFFGGLQQKRPKLMQEDVSEMWCSHWYYFFVQTEFFFNKFSSWKLNTVIDFSHFGENKRDWLSFFLAGDLNQSLIRWNFSFLMLVSQGNKNSVSLLRQWWTLTNTPFTSCAVKQLELPVCKWAWPPVPWPLWSTLNTDAMMMD